MGAYRGIEPVVFNNIVTYYVYIIIKVTYLVYFIPILSRNFPGNFHALPYDRGEECGCYGSQCQMPNICGQ